ncbi:metallo-beta-lactamase superfamily protein [Colletotrichum incanum]|uniref:Metallo-beta-lactamase superfamily protein n=1 Tax=Colletotrichum incanum TaxID=1573173 RepID=A0A161YBP9_COLIC|nr:metallo-beta-lactamase superfamily protein [Colletotrichum incanum]
MGVDGRINYTSHRRGLIPNIICRVDKKLGSRTPSYRTPIWNRRCTGLQYIELWLVLLPNRRITVYDASLDVPVIFDSETSLPSIVRIDENHPIFKPSVCDLLFSECNSVNGIHYFKATLNHRRLLGDYRAAEDVKNPAIDSFLIKVPGQRADATVPKRSSEYELGRSPSGLQFTCGTVFLVSNSPLSYLINPLDESQKYLSYNCLQAGLFHAFEDSYVIIMPACVTIDNTIAKFNADHATTAIFDGIEQAAPTTPLERVAYDPGG